MSKYTIKNFRVFNQDGTTFDLDSITILTGCNSSGKSSLVKSMMLLSNYMSALRAEMSNVGKCHPSKHYLGITNPALKLGSYSGTLHRGESNDGKIHFSYTHKPDMGTLEVEVEYVFGTDSRDCLNEGWLKEIIVRSCSGDLICHLKDVAGEFQLAHFDCNSLKGSYLSFMRYCFFQTIRNISESLVYLGEEKVGMKESDLIELKRIYDEDIKTSSYAHISDEERLSFDRFYKTLSSDEKHDLLSNVILGDVHASIKNNLLCYMPILDELHGIAKSEVAKILSNYDDSAWLKAIITDFENSKHESFIDYCIEKERESLNKKYQLIVGVGGSESIPDCFRHRISISAPFEYLYEEAKKDGSVALDSSCEVTPEHQNLFDGQDKEEKERALKRLLHPDYKILVDVLRRLSCKVSERYCHSYSTKDIDVMTRGVEHPLSKSFGSFVQLFMTEALLPTQLFNEMHYLGADNIQVQRLYAADSHSDDFAGLLNKYLILARNLKNDDFSRLVCSAPSQYEPGSFLNTWVEKFGLCHHVAIENVVDGLGLVVRLYDTDEDKEGHLLADEGFGITQIFAIMLKIEIMICDSMLNGRTNQVLAIEEPENHLHPNYQSLLADMFWDAYTQYHITFLIETHSEYLVRKSQVMVAGLTKNAQPNPFRVYYFPRDGKPYDMEYKSNGRFAKKFGNGFFDEASKLAFEIF